MATIGYVFAAMIAIAIIFIGARFLLAPAVAARGYGVPIAASTEFPAYPAVKGLRDIVSGLFIVLLMAEASSRLVGEFLLVASLIAFGDALIVVRSEGSRAVALGVHAATGLFILVAGALLMAARP